MKNNTLTFFSILIMCYSIVAISQTELNQFMNRLEHAYTDLNLIKSIDDFKDQLLNKGIIQKSDMNDPSIIYSKLDESLSDLEPSDFGIDKWINKDPFNTVMASENLFESSQLEQSSVALFVYYQLLSDKYRNFNIHLEEKRLLKFNGLDLPINSIEGVIFEEIDKRYEKGITTQNAKIVLTADPYTDMEFVQFIMSKFREIGIRQVVFDRKKDN